MIVENCFYCMQDTAGNHEMGCPDNPVIFYPFDYYTVPPSSVCYVTVGNANSYGWICPRCGQVHAPFISSCWCLLPTQNISSNEPDKSVKAPDFDTLTEGYD